MGNTKCILLIVFMFVSNLALAQHCTYSIDTFSINHYACLEKKQRIIIYKHQSPGDIGCGDNNHFDIGIWKCRGSSDTTIFFVVRCTDGVLGRLELINRDSLDTNLCICPECGQYQVGEDSLLTSTYHPLDGVFTYSIDNMKNLEKVRWKKRRSVFAVIKKKQMNTIYCHSSKCNLTCNISNSDFPYYLYVVHPNYPVSYLIEISSGNIDLKSHPFQIP